MSLSRGHLAWLAVCFAATLAYPAWFLFRIFAVGINVSGPFNFALFLMVFYTLPVTGFYLMGLAVRWVAPKAIRIPGLLIRMHSRAADRLDDAAFGLKI